MGPGLVFALLTALFAPLRAETPVGLDARGVDPMAAVDNAQGLDVRDELGRPVSGRVVLAQMKQASAARAAEAAYASTLPKARAVLAALELGEAAGAWLIALSAARRAAQVWASLPAPRPKVSALLLAAVALALASAAAAVRRCGCRLPPLPFRGCPEVLRC